MSNFSLFRSYPNNIMPSTRTGKKNSTASVIHDLLSKDDTDLTETPCAYCEEIIKGDCVECHDCGGWVDRKCSGLSERKFELLCLSQDDDSVRWVCKVCVSGESEKQGVLAKKLDRMFIMFSNLSTELQAIKNNQKQQGANLEEKISKIVDQKLKERLDQIDEKEKREKNIVIFGIAESKETGIAAKAEDLSTVQDLITSHCPEILDEDITEPIRLGKNKPAEGDKPRPLKLKMSSVKAKWSAIKISKAININRSIEERIYINPDLSNEERVTQKALRTQLKARKAAGENDLIIKGDKIVKKPQPAQERTALEAASSV